MARRAGVSILTTTYGKFRGVDFSTDPALVDASRSPWAVNMMADTGGMPEKRPGWRTLHRLESPINGLFYAVIDGVTHFIAHAGGKIYRWTESAQEPVVLRAGVYSGPSAAVNMSGKLWILTGREYIVYDGDTVRDVAEVAKTPTVIIAGDPKTGSGATYEAVNLLTARQTAEYTPDGTTKMYQLPVKNLDSERVTVTVWGQAKTEGSDFTVDRAAGTVTFSAAPEKAAVGAETGVVITYAKTIEGYHDRIAKCTIATSYGVGKSDRLIVSGNPDRPNVDWISELDDPSYIPDNSYAVVGDQATAIIGYRRLGEYLAVIKADNGQDSTVFLRSANVSEAGVATFPLRQSIAGVGAVSKRGFGNIGDEQLFLSGDGVYALTTNALTAERIVQNRSFFVDARLNKESGLDKAAAVSWAGMYLVAVNGHVYVLDGRQDKTYRAKSQGDYIYECYYWENVPAVCWMNHKTPDGGETLYFGTEDGRVCHFKSGVTAMERYNDDGEAIKAVWSTPADDDGDVTIYKTLLKKGNSVTLKPYTRSSAKVYFRTEEDPVAWMATEGELDIFDWADIDFRRFTFNANDAPREILFNTKVKRYKRLQVIIINDAVNEGFGVFGITKHYVTGNFAKR